MKRTVLSLTIWCSTVALAQTTNLETVWLDPGGRGSLEVGNGQTLGHLNARAGAALFDTYGVFRTPGGSVVVRDRLGVQVFAGLGLLSWLELSANVPVIVFQTGAGASVFAASAGLGNPWVHLKASILDGAQPMSLGVDLGFGLPVGSEAALANGGFEFAPKLQLGKVFSEFQLAGEVGFLYQPTADFSAKVDASNVKFGSRVWVAVTATTVNTTGPRGEITVRMTAPLTGTRAGLEGQLGVRWPVGPLEFFGSVGPGFGGAPGTPGLRAYFGFALASTPMTQPPCVEGRAYELKDCPDLDRDLDGVKNAVDQAPLEPEDRDGYQDDDGVPDPDNDRDTLLDTEDQCPMVMGPRDNRGCPDSDSDHDGLVDRLDRCPHDAEDKDGFQDEDGCPDLDNDGDGVDDGQDRCPNEAGPASEGGCPVKDVDGDGVSDSVDNCPNEKGVPENAGCPVAQKQLVIITAEKLKILDKVYFDTGRSTIQRRSNALLDNVAKVLVSHPEISLIQVEGHTDNVGNAESNKKLSQQRADAVKTYLINKSVPETRLRAVGFGQDMPSETNDTPAGREANRRVEFNIIQQGDGQ